MNFEQIMEGISDENLQDFVDNFVKILQKESINLMEKRNEINSIEDIENNLEYIF